MRALVIPLLLSLDSQFYQGIPIFTESCTWLGSLSRTCPISCLCVLSLSLMLLGWCSALIKCMSYFLCSLLFLPREGNWINFTDGCSFVSPLFCLVVSKVEESLTVLIEFSKDLFADTILSTTPSIFFLRFYFSEQFYRFIAKLRGKYRVPQTLFFYTCVLRCSPIIHIPH